MALKGKDFFEPLPAARPAKPPPPPPQEPLCSDCGDPANPSWGDRGKIYCRMCASPELRFAARSYAKRYGSDHEE